MKKSMNDYVSVYKEQLAICDIRIAYKFLIKYVMTIKSSFEKNPTKNILAEISDEGIWILLTFRFLIAT